MADEWGPWVAHNGCECPVDPDAVVQVCTKETGVLGSAAAKKWSWSHDESTCQHIIAYRVKREPVVETVRQSLTATERGIFWFVTQSAHAHRINGCLVYETRDGIPDMTTLRWEDAD